MPPRKRATGKSAKPAKSLEQTLWEAADKMRGNLEAAEYKHVVLGLVFLKYVSDAFEQRRRWLEAATADETNTDYYVPNPAKRDDIIEARDEYTAENVFWVPVEARWSVPAGSGQAARDRHPHRRRDGPHRAGEPFAQGRAPQDVRPSRDRQAAARRARRPDRHHRLHRRRPRRRRRARPRVRVLPRPFAATEGRNAGEFYTPRSVVRLLVEMLEPFEGRVFDPCCGSGGMFVQSAEFVAAHGGKRDDALDLRPGVRRHHLAAGEDEPRASAASMPTSATAPTTRSIATCSPICAPTSSWPTRRSTRTTGSPTRCATIPAGSTGCRPRATPTTRGCSTSSTTSRRTASRASCSPTAASRPRPAAKARSAASWWRPTWSTASSRCRRSCSSTRASR